MSRYLLCALLALFTIGLTNASFADSDEPPLFVASSGHDAGNCQDASTPCGSIQYALARLGKNGLLQVGEGSYELSDAADIIYLLSGAIDVRGSYANGSSPTLTGVPPEFAADLQRKGFRILTDSKDLHQDAVNTQQSLKANATATVCAGGFAGIFPCNNVDLLAHIAERTPAARGADIWGFMDLNTHREYVILGYSTGTAIYDVSDPETPREVGFVDGQTTTWRDIKIRQVWNAANRRWNAYAYVSADNASDGLVIIDLSALPHRVSKMAYTSDFSAAHNVYLMDTDFGTGLSLVGSHSPNLILAGANLSDGRFRSYGLSNAASPAFSASPATPGGQGFNDRLYMHDAASMVVSDARKDSQCVNASARDHCDILFDFNESTIDIWDVSNPSSPSRLSQLPYSNSRYTHSGWPSEDQQYLFVQDELDERDLGLATTLRVVSIADLTAPAVVGQWVGPTSAIDHNGFVRGNRYYMSNYTRGLTILDISNPENPISAGRFDTYPASDITGFPGNWGTYPYLPSGNIALSDIDSGLYIVADNTLAVVQGTLAFSATAFGTDETQSVDLVVNRSGGAQGATRVDWQVIAASGAADDVVTNRGVLNWPDGDSSSRTINLGLSNDGVTEGLERVLVKLFSPTGGATLSSPSIASAYISDPGESSALGFSTDTIDIGEREFGTAVAVIQRSGSAIGIASVDYAINAGDATNGSDYSGPATGTLSWADGNANPQWIEYAIVDDGTGETDEFFEIGLSNPSGASIAANAVLRVNILDGNVSNSAPNSVTGVSQTVNSGTTVTLNGSASNDPDGDTLSYAWSQTLGPGVTLTNANSVSASFTAPAFASDTLMRFDLQVSDSGGLSDTSTTSVTVRANAPVVSGGGGGALGIWMLCGLLGVRVLTRRDAS